MSALLARIMLAIFMLPAAALVYLIVYVVTWQNSRAWFSSDDVRMVTLTAGAASWVVIALWWILLWRHTVRWTRARLRSTIGSAAGALLLAGLIGSVLRGIDRDFSLFVFTVCVPIIWLPLSVNIWRESREERAVRLAGSTRAIVCPTCGYNLTGLTTARCPECGSTFTLDDLISRQPPPLTAGSAELENP